MKTKRLLQLISLLSLFHIQNVRAAESDPKLPVLTGKVIFAEGSFFGYMPPQAGDTVKLDLGALDSITNRIVFEGKNSQGAMARYIPLLVPLHVSRIQRDNGGKLTLARLISGAKESDGTERIIIDIQRAGTSGSAWIIQEDDGVVVSVARLECTFSR